MVTEPAILLLYHKCWFCRQNNNYSIQLTLKGPLGIVFFKILSWWLYPTFILVYSYFRPVNIVSKSDPNRGRGGILTNVSALVFYSTTTLQNSFWHFLWCYFPLLLLLGKCWWSRSSRLPRNEGLSSALSHKYLHSVYIRVDLYTLAEIIIYTVFLSFQGDQGIRGDKVKETELPWWFNGNFY